jgi:hypothetical protein
MLVNAVGMSTLTIQLIFRTCTLKFRFHFSTDKNSNFALLLLITFAFIYVLNYNLMQKYLIAHKYPIIIQNHQLPKRAV